MFDKRVYLILLLILMIGTISSVSANDLNQTTEIAGESTTQNVDIAISEDTDVVNVTQKSFTDLNEDINGNDNADIYLNDDYTFNPNGDAGFNEGINITRSLTIWGNGHTLNGNNFARIFLIDAENVVLHDIVFINAKSVTDGGAVSGDCTAYNCTFINNSAVAYGGAVREGYYVNCSFIQNTASNAGAASGASCVNCSFTENYATYRGGAAIATTYGSIVNCTFMRNNANLDGGAIYYGSNVKTTISDCTFTENSANVGGAVYFSFEDSVVNCNFTRNRAVWEAGAARSATCVNCSFTENSADYAGAIKYGRATNCIFTENFAIFGGASCDSTSRNCTFIRNYADYGGAIYDSFITINCTFLGNYAGFGGAIYAGSNVKDCDFISNSARNGGATYKIEAKNCYFIANEATENGGAMYGETATDCLFKDNIANGSGNDTFNTVISNSSFVGNIIYFDASAAYDGNGSEDNPYKYLYADRITPGVTAYFEEGTYDFNGTCVIFDARLIGKTSRAIINCWISNQYDFIIPQNSYLELKNLQINNANILNQATLFAKDVSFGRNDVFDEDNLPEIPSGSGYFDSTYGGVIVCDTPDNVKSTLMLDACYFMNLYDTFNGGAIAAINSDIFISNTNFMYYSATYKGGAIYCRNSNLNMYNTHFNPFSVSDEVDSTSGRYNDYTSYYGGTLYCEDSDIFIFRCNFNSSVSFSFGGCIASLNSRISIEESNFNDSISLIDGGGAIYSSKSEMYVFDTTFNRNSAEFGGAICNVNSVLDLYHTKFLNNFANCYGGSIYDIYGTIDLYTNWFYVSHASVGGAIYTRIPNSFNLYSNHFGDCFAQEGSSIFFDGKKETIGSSNHGFIDSVDSVGLEKYNSFGNEYHLIAELRATLNGEEYYLISNPLFYQLSSSESSSLYMPYSVFEVHDGLANIMIYDRDDYSYLTSIATGNVVRNVSAIIGISEEFVNPVLNFYLIEDLNIYTYFDRDSSTNVYTGSRDSLFEGRNIVKTYSIDLSEIAVNNDYYFTVTTNVDFEKSILSIKSDNLYDANSLIPVSLIDGQLNDSSSAIGALPSYYNSNDYGYVSSVKDQKNGGNCWAFAGLATLETCLKKATGVTYDFSEENAKNLMAAYSVYGIKIETNFAGYDSMIMSYLTSWLGPIDESAEGYDDFSSISVLQNPMFHIQNIKFLPVRHDSTDNALYKMAIRDYGAVSVMFKWGKDYHAVSLVGWDDSYNGKDSLGNDANGAWIFKNSYGGDWENDGFGYLAYSQKISEQIDPGMHAYTFIFSDVNPYDKIYQYDFAGVSQFYHYQGSIHFKNTFVAEDDSLLSAFSTYFDTQTNYTVSVYVNDQFVFAQNGTSAAGYYTIPFKNFIQLDKDDKFTIAIHNHNIDGYSCIPVCYAEEITKKTFTADLSFVSLDGETWYDLYDYADSCHVACIKAFTQNIHLTSINISTNEFKTINTNNFNVKVSFDEFAGIDSINYCLVKFNVDGKTYYAQIKDGLASLNLNLDNGVHNLSAQYKDNVFESNVIQFTFTVDSSQESYSLNGIQDMVNRASDKSTIVLNHDYAYDEKYDDGEYGVFIDKQIAIDGKGHTINGLSKATAFYIAANNVVLSNIVFDNTFAINGGGIYVAGRNVTLNNCSFINSTATQSGGGIYSLFDLNLNGCKFINDSANTGGGLYLVSTATSYIENSCFDNNYASTHGSAIYVSGVGTTLVSSTDFTDNSAKYNGGAVFSAVKRNNFTDCNFVNNSARSGGAIFSNAKFNEIANCRFLNNSVLESGGAITVHSNINIYNSDFINNSVTDKNPYDYGAFGGYGGGAIYSYQNLNVYDSNFINNTVVTSGGAIYTSEYLNVYRSTFINNSASRSGGAVHNSIWQMFRTNMGITQFSETHFYDSLFIDNTAGDNGGAISSSSLVQNCTFINNSGSNDGGALYDAKVVNCSRFINNSANYGGAIFYIGLVPFYSYDSVFIDNHAEATGGAIYSNLFETLLAQVVSNVFIRNGSFINNSANYGGAIYSLSDMDIYSSSFINNFANYGGVVATSGNGCIYFCNFTENHADAGGVYMSDGNVDMHDSSFSYNSAVWGAVIYINGNISIDSCNFTNNCANKSGGVVYGNDKCDVANSYFANNSARTAAGIYSINGVFIADSIFANNSVSYSGGAIYSAGECLVFNCEFYENSANYGGAITSDGTEYEVISSINVSSCRFSGNLANYSGGAVYMGGTGMVNGSMFDGNKAMFGGAIYLGYNGTGNVKTSCFNNNSAEYGGAIFSNAPDEQNIAYADISLCNFTQNYANTSGGAVYFDGRCVISNSTFLENCARRGTTIFSKAYLDLRNSNIKSRQNNDSIYFAYHYYENHDCYGDLVLKNNKFDVESVAICFSEDELPYKYPLNIVFSNITVTKGQFVLVCHLEDEYGNRFFGCGDLNLTLVDQNKNIINLRLKDDFDLGGYFLNTSSIAYANYSLSGKISAGHPDNYVVHDGSLTVGDGSNRTYVMLSSSGLTKVYGNTKKLTVTLKDANGNPIANTYVYIKLNGKTTKVKTGSDGKASLAVSLVPKTYTATISYYGSDDCYPATKTVKVVIKKATPKIYASKKTFNLNVKTKKYTITLKNNKGKVIKNAQVKIKVNGKTYSAKTNSKGKATFNINKLAKKGSFKSKITYSGSKYYNKVTKTVTITVK